MSLPPVYQPWTNFIPKDEPAYELGDGVDNWPMMQAGGAAGSSARDWLLYVRERERERERF